MSVLYIPLKVSIIITSMYTLAAMLNTFSSPKSSLERVSNAVRGCIDGVYRELMESGL